MADLKAIIRALAGPLEVEARRGYRDTAIIGQSLGQYVRGWAEQAVSVVVGEAEHARIDRLRQLLSDYQALKVETRRQRVQEALKLLGEIGGGGPSGFPGRAGAQGERSRRHPTTGARDAAKAASGRPAPGKPAREKTGPSAPLAGQALGVSSAAPVLQLLDQPVEEQRKPTPSWVKRLGSLGISTNRDLLFHFPRDYLPLRRIAEVVDGERAALLVKAGARQESVIREGRGFRLMRYGLEVGDDTGAAAVTSVARVPRYGARAQIIANSPLALHYPEGATLLIEGVVRRIGQVAPRPGIGPPSACPARGGSAGEAEIQYGGSERVREGDAPPPGALVPVYPLTEGVYQGQVRGAVRKLLERLPAGLEDPLPGPLRDRHHLPSLARALRDIHWPSSPEAKDAARRRLAFEELLVLELAMAQRKRERQRPKTGVRMPPRGDVIGALAEAVPFALTRAQQRVISEIVADMASDTPMHRLLQGDVGSGKTVVGMAALVIAVQNGFQGALMAPTELLAEQHYLVLSRMLRPLGLPVLLLTGSIRGADREQVLREAGAGRAAVIIGTHALIQEGVEFARLGLVIVDEQHRFGVRQRAELLTKGIQGQTRSAGRTAVPHMLVMTATPIPRSLALTLYGDLDISVLDEMPPGRREVKTRWYDLPPGQGSPGRGHGGEAFELVRRQVAEGRQAYVVCPLIEESEELQAQAATKVAEELQRGDFSDLRVGLLHGAMKVDEREAKMEAFRSGELDVLTATTVVEVGVDVPNATIMVILNAERFGLAQLHQLRGRVGRGGHESYCLLLTPGKYDPTGRLAPAGEESLDLARRRLEMMLKTNDGFAIAEQDLLLRGPGEMYGTRQHGLPDFRLARLTGDLGVLTEAREAAFSLVGSDPELGGAEHGELRTQVAALRARMERLAG